MSAVSIVTWFFCLAPLVNVKGATFKLQTAMATNMSLTASLEAELNHRENPVRKVVKVLTDVQTKINKEASDDKKTFDEYICFCQSKGVKITHEIEEFNDGMSDLDSEIKSLGAHKGNLEGKYAAAKHKFDMDEAHLAKLKTLRGKELAAYLARKRELDKDLDALRHAIPAIEDGLESKSSIMFLQSSAAPTLVELAKDENIEIDESDRDALVSFLSSKGRPDPKYEPGAGEIVGILKQIKDELETELYNLVHDEDISVAEYQAMVSSIRKDEATLNKRIQEYLKSLANDGIALAEDKGYKSDLYDSLLTDKEYLERLTVRCHEKKDEYKERYYARSGELKAIAETIQILDSAEASEMFRKVLGKPSAFIQMEVASTRMRQEVADKLRASNTKRDPRVDLIEIALRGGKTGFERVIDKIDKLIEILKKEQDADTDKLAWCRQAFAQATLDNESTTMDIENFGMIVKQKQTIHDDLEAEVAKLKEDIAGDEKDAEEQTKLRKAENSEYLTKLGSNTAALHVLDMAVNRLQKFYNPEAYNAKIGYNLVQSDSKEGPIEMLEKIIADLKEENKVLEITEKRAQEAYEELINDEGSATSGKRKMLGDKQSELAKELKALNEAIAKLKAGYVDDHENQEEIKSLHAQCDFLDKYHDVRKESRNQEIENLQSAIAILSGATVIVKDKAE